MTSQKPAKNTPYEVEKGIVSTVFEMNCVSSQEKTSEFKNKILKSGFGRYWLIL